MDGYLELLISSYMNYKHPLYTTFGEGFSTLFAYLTIITCLILMPLVFLRIFTRPVHYYCRHNMFYKRMEPLFKSLKNNHKIYIAYTLSFFARRYIFVVLVYSFADYITI